MKQFCRGVPEFKLKILERCASFTHYPQEEACAVKPAHVCLQQEAGLQAHAIFARLLKRKIFAASVGITQFERHSSEHGVLAPFTISINPIEFLAGVDN